MERLAELNGFAGINLEDSFVLDVVADLGGIRLRAEFVLTPEHAAYAAPAPGQHYCIRPGVLEYTGLTSLEWTYSSEPPAVDANNERDYGGFDSYRWDGTTHFLEGGWGLLVIRCKDVRLGLT